MLSPDEIQALQRQPWLASCGAPLRDWLLGQGWRLRLSAGQPLFERGQPAHGLCTVLRGALRVGAVQRDGSASMLATLEPGPWFGEISLIDGLPRTHDAVAEGPTEVWCLPQQALLDWLEQHPAAWRDIARLACDKLRVCFEVLEDQSQLPLPARLAKRLLLLARGYQSGPPESSSERLRLRLAQEQLAQMLGVSRQSINKALGGLAQAGLLALHYGEIELLDRAGLQALAQG
jgi:CRP-like cAMP-binding protein